MVIEEKLITELRIAEAMGAVASRIRVIFMRGPCYGAGGEAGDRLGIVQGRGRLAGRCRYGLEVWSSGWFFCLALLACFAGSAFPVCRSVAGAWVRRKRRAYRVYDGAGD
jgi:hypothetical protein